MVVSGPANEQSLRDDPAGGFGLETHRREPTMTLAGWRRFVDTPTAHFELLPDKRWATCPTRTRKHTTRPGSTCGRPVTLRTWAGPVTSFQVVERAVIQGRPVPVL
jgi:hypothetical protein